MKYWHIARVETSTQILCVMHGVSEGKRELSIMMNIENIDWINETQTTLSEISRLQVFNYFIALIVHTVQYVRYWWWYKELILAYKLLQS